MPRLSSRTPPRWIILAVVTTATAANCILGPRMYPQYSLAVAGWIGAFVFGVWLVDAVVMSKRSNGGEINGTRRIDSR